MKQSRELVFHVAISVIVIGIMVSIFWHYSYAQEQQQQPSSTGVKIISPGNNEEFEQYEGFIIYGTAPYNSSNHNCKVSITVNTTEPNQPAYAIGSNGLLDYSQWEFGIDELNEGNNTITARYSCDDNPNSISFDTVNIQGYAEEVGDDERLYESPYSAHPGEEVPPPAEEAPEGGEEPASILPN
jgi:hypothetical protein